MVIKIDPRKGHILGTNSKAVVQTSGKYTRYTERNGTPKLHQAMNKVDSHFWREAIKATTTMNKNRNPESIKTKPIWNNKNIHYKGYPLFCNRWCRVGIDYLQDLWSNGHMMSYEDIRQKVGTSGTLHFTV